MRTARLSSVIIIMGRMVRGRDIRNTAAARKKTANGHHTRLGTILVQGAHEVKTHTFEWSNSVRFFPSKPE